MSETWPTNEQVMAACRESKYTDVDRAGRRITRFIQPEVMLKILQAAAPHLSKGECNAEPSLRESPTFGRWLPIETHNPEDDGYVLAKSGKIPFVAAYDDQDDEWTTFNRYYETATLHQPERVFRPTQWMPLPPDNSEVTLVDWLAERMSEGPQENAAPPPPASKGEWRGIDEYRDEMGWVATCRAGERGANLCRRVHGDGEVYT